MRGLIAIGLVMCLSGLAMADDGLESFIREAREVCVEKFNPDTYGICVLEKFKPYATDFYRLQNGQLAEKFRFDPVLGISLRAVAIACGRATSKDGGRIEVITAMSCVRQKVDEVKEQTIKRRSMTAEEWVYEEAGRVFSRAISLWCPDPLLSEPICQGFVATRMYSPCARKFIDVDRGWIDSEALWACVSEDYVRRKAIWAK